MMTSALQWWYSLHVLTDHIDTLLLSGLDRTSSSHRVSQLSQHRTDSETVVMSQQELMYVWFHMILYVCVFGDIPTRVPVCHTSSNSSSDSSWWISSPPTILGARVFEIQIQRCELLFGRPGLWYNFEGATIIACGKENGTSAAVQTFKRSDRFHLWKNNFSWHGWSIYWPNI